MHSNNKPIILTTGEPSGIGLDLCIMLADYLLSENIVLCGDINLLKKRAKHFNKMVNFHLFDLNNPTIKTQNSIPVLHIDCPEPVVIGSLNSNNSQYVLNILDTACEMTNNKIFSAIVTAPIHKGIICEAGHKFSGHTEFFAEKLNVKKPVMLLANSNLKVALMTTHLPLKDVSEAITPELINEIVYIVNKDIKQYFTKTNPKIGVCGLNPHAGESGHMGKEELEIINPTLKKLREQGIDVSDALPADTLFVPAHSNQYDVIISMFHDQGLPVIKSQGFGGCVNVTLGLPIIRTSVDHGTALDLAGTNKANPSSLQCAISLAKSMTNNH